MAPAARRLLAVPLALLLLAVPGCARSEPAGSGDSSPGLSGEDLARYLPSRLSGLRVGKVPPTMNEDIASEADVYGTGDWVESFQGATMVAGAGDVARGFVAVVRRGDPDPEMEMRVALFGSGVGTFGDTEDVQIAGERVRTGVIENANGTFPYAVWSPEQTSVTVAVVARGPESSSGLDPAEAMEELITAQGQP